MKRQRARAFPRVVVVVVGGERRLFKMRATATALWRFLEKRRRRE
jgi:hypothetical protein